jgi:hypothetical protein
LPHRAAPARRDVGEVRRAGRHGGRRDADRRRQLSLAPLDVAEALSETRLHTLALWLLSNVPGFPPIVQTVHLLAVAAVMGSIVMIDLRVMGLALRGQPAEEVLRRLAPWTWGALPILAASGLVFVVAQPHRYAVNPVFAIKFVLLAPAALLAAVSRWAIAPDRALAKVIAAISLALWVGVVLAGRWIAYADYLFAME